MTTLRKINCLALACLISAAPAISQDDDFGYSGSDNDSLSVDQMDIDGIYRKRRSQAERLENSRRKLERKNENLVRQKIEDARIKEEQKMTDKLRRMFKRNSLRNDELDEDHAPKKIVTEKIYVQPEPKHQPARFKVIPSIGAMVVDSENVSYDSSSAFGISFESMINSQFSIGMGVNYGKVDIKDINLGYFGFYSGFNTGAFNARQMNYRRTTLDLTGKFFVLPDSNVNPYFGAAIGYSRDRLRYDNNNNGFGGFNNFNQGYQETYKRNYASWSAMAGTEVKFSRHFGINLELKHSRGFGSNNNNTNQVFIPTPDQLNLNRLGNELSEASFTSLNFGVVGSF